MKSKINLISVIIGATILAAVVLLFHGASSGQDSLLSLLPEKKVVLSNVRQCTYIISRHMILGDPCSSSPCPLGYSVAACNCSIDENNSDDLFPGQFTKGRLANIKVLPDRNVCRCDYYFSPVGPNDNDRKEIETIQAVCIKN
jgi:hypothetical protein